MKVTADTGFGLEDLSVANNDGQPHAYGWEIDLVNKTVDYYFDGANIAPGRQALFTPVNGNEHHFGDATGGETHHDIYHSFWIRQTVYPEPGSIIFVGGGLVMLALRRRSA
ncbi:MAG: hypothetical protein CMJ18_06075 [Phycisphaeraceae bacterium]|nr:hypothetical protein [Phycisphaeraceae bacterium]